MRKIRPHLRITQNMKKIFAFSAFLSLCAAHLPAADISADFAEAMPLSPLRRTEKSLLPPIPPAALAAEIIGIFCVRKASGKLLEISVSGKNAVDACGAFVSEDSAKTGRRWARILSADVAIPQNSHTASRRTPPKSASLPSYPICIRILKDSRNRAESQSDISAKPSAGAKTCSLSSGNEDSAVTVILTCRHHACESAASFVLEGFLSSAKYAKNIRVAAFPLVDLDGVEEGEQGKFRKPRDHNQDYYGTSRYAATATLKRILEKLNADGKKTVVLDLHSPLFSEMSNLATRANGIYFVFGKNGKKRNLAKGFSLKLAERCNESGGLANNPELDVDFDPFLHDRRPITFAKWAERLENVMWSAAMEIPFAASIQGEMPSTPDQLRNFGKALLEELDAHAGVDWESSGK